MAFKWIVAYLNIRISDFIYHTRLLSHQIHILNLRFCFSIYWIINWLRIAMKLIKNWIWRKRGIFCNTKKCQQVDITSYFFVPPAYSSYFARNKSCNFLQQYQILINAFEIMNTFKNPNSYWSFFLSKWLKKRHSNLFTMTFFFVYFSF